MGGDHNSQLDVIEAMLCWNVLQVMKYEDLKEHGTEVMVKVRGEAKRQP